MAIRKRLSDTHKDALKRLDLKPGDFVEVTFGLDEPSDWNDYWTAAMDKCVGKTFRVLKVDQIFGVTLNTSENSSIDTIHNWAFPATVLSIVKRGSCHLPNASEAIYKKSRRTAVKSGTETKYMGDHFDEIEYQQQMPKFTTSGNFDIEEETSKLFATEKDFSSMIDSLKKECGQPPSWVPDNSINPYILINS